MVVMRQDEAKQLAAQRALEFVEDGMALGLGSGTTATLFIHALGKQVRRGLRVRCIASSRASAELAQSLGIPLTTFEDCPALDLAVDGADEVGPELALIKGAGGALLREKIVASAARQFLVVADSSKQVERLGRSPLPVEVIHLALPLVRRRLAERNLNPKLRRSSAGVAYVTDEGNCILDCDCGEIRDPAALANEIRGIVGVVEHGLFLKMATLAVIAGDGGIIERHR